LGNLKSLRSISIYFAEEDEEEAKAMNDVDAGRDRATVGTLGGGELIRIQ
jgi:hypothetical protein